MLLPMLLPLWVVLLVLLPGRTTTPRHHTKGQEDLCFSCGLSASSVFDLVFLMAMRTHKKAGCMMRHEMQGPDTYANV